MPEMSGLELLQWMRQQPQYQKVPFIMITSRGDKDHVIEAVKEGFLNTWASLSVRMG